APTIRADLFPLRALARILPADRARSRLSRRLLALAGMIAALLARFRIKRLAVPFRIVEVEIRFHEVVDREIVLTVIKTSAASDDLLELNHRVDRTHQHNVPNVSGVDAG